MYIVIRVFFLAVLLHSLGCAAPQFQMKATSFETENGKSVDAELGELRVPERRDVPDSGDITLRFVRFKSTSPNPGPPIVYLAGGPGGSGIEAAKDTRFPLFMAMREFGDVIALDQRGTGQSRPDLDCDEPFEVPFDQPLTRGALTAAMHGPQTKCIARLRRSRVDLAGYNTRESAADIEDLRKALGAPKVVLWGISYGTHLATAFMRFHGASVDRAILAGIEGPDDTYKMPAHQQALLEAIAQRAAATPAIQQRMPDLLETLGALLAELEARPKRVELVHPMTGAKGVVAVGKLDLQVAVAQMLEGPDTFSTLPNLLWRLERGDWTALALQAVRLRVGEVPKAMGLAMDCASGVTDARRRRIAEQAPRTLLGDAINLPFPGICTAVEVPDLGDAFRAPLQTALPVLMISGTLDGRTPPAQAQELARGIPNSVQLVIEGAGHSDPLFLSSPKILEAMQSFMRGKQIAETRIRVTPKPFEPLYEIIEVPDGMLARLAGEYRVSPKSQRTIVQAGSVLYSIRDHGMPVALRSISATEFVGEGSGVRARFELDRKGNVVAMVMRQTDGSEQRATRR